MSIFKKLKSKKTGDTAIENGQLDKKVDTAVKKSALVSDKKLTFALKQAWTTEKSGHLAALRKYPFIVDRHANKIMVKKAVEAVYGVKVKWVNIINTKGKTKRLGRSTGRTSAFKKAVVTLKEGQHIDIMPT